jgi:hypothetical protein
MQFFRSSLISFLTNCLNKTPDSFQNLKLHPISLSLKNSDTPSVDFISTPSKSLSGEKDFDVNNLSVNDFLLYPLKGFLFFIFYLFFILIFLSFFSIWCFLVYFLLFFFFVFILSHFLI